MLPDDLLIQAWKTESGEVFKFGDPVEGELKEPMLFKRYHYEWEAVLVCDSAMPESEVKAAFKSAGVLYEDEDED